MLKWLDCFDSEIRKIRVFEKWASLRAKYKHELRKVNPTAAAQSRYKTGKVFHEGEYAAKNSLNFEIKDVLTKTVEN